MLDVLLEMRKYRMGLIQTAAQLRFSFQAILEGSKKILLEDDHTNNSNVPIMRSLGMNEEENTTEDIVLDETNLSKNDDADKEESQLRQRNREEKRQKTQDTINRIKRKQKEVEERLKFNQKLYKYLTPIFCVGVAICVGVFIFVKKDSTLVNYE